MTRVRNQVFLENLSNGFGSREASTFVLRLKKNSGFELVRFFGYVLLRVAT